MKAISHRPYDGPLLTDTRHAVEVEIEGISEESPEHMRNAEALAMEYVCEHVAKSQPYPFRLTADYPDNGSNFVKVYWTEDDEERLITTKIAYSWDAEANDGKGAYDGGHLDVTWQMHEPGDMVKFENAAPGVGFVTFKVTRKDDTGLWGICNEDTRWIPEGDYYE